jgi:voltage-gated potassium channel
MSYAGYSLRLRAVVALALVGSILTVGTLGYSRIEGQPLLQSFYYMSMIFTAQGPPTIPKTEAGLVFSAIMAYISIGVLVSSIGFIFGPLFIQGVKRVVERVEESLELKEHVIICGYNEMSRILIEGLKKQGKPVVLIDEDSSTVDSLVLGGTPAITGDATSTSVLEKAQVRTASALVSCFQDDSKNALTVLTAKKLKSGIFCISRVTQEENVEKLKMVMADSIVSPTVVGAKMIMDELGALKRGA